MHNLKEDFIKEIENEINNLSPRAARFEYLLKKLKQEKNSLSKCIRFLEDMSRQNYLQLFYFGGFLRDLWLEFTPRDIDIVFNKVDEKQFEYLTEEYFISKNRFGGLKLEIEGVNVDAWPIQYTWTFAKEKILPKSINHLPETTFFSIDSIVLEVYAPNERRWGWEQGFFEACETKTLEIQQHENPFPALQLVRAYELSNHLGFKAGENLKEYIKSNLDKTNPSELSNTYEKHYGNSINPIELYIRLEKLVN